MSRHRKMGAISTTEMLLLAGGAFALIYFMKSKPATPTILTIPAGGTPAGAAAQTTTSEVNAAASVANNIINSIWGD